MMNNTSLKVSIVLPTYNEVDNIIILIDELINQLKQKNHTYEIMVVDDDSPDFTWKKVEEYGRTDPNVTLVHRKNESGLTSAINAGIERARGDIVVWMDCDLSHPPKLMSVLLEGVDGGNDVVIASRYVEGGVDLRHGSYEFQKFLSLFLVKISKLALKSPVLDVTSGYIAGKHECLKKVLPLEGDYGEYFIDLVCKLGRLDCRIKEIPYEFKNRAYGESKTATNIRGYFMRGVKYLRMILKHSISSH